MTAKSHFFRLHVLFQLCDAQPLPTVVEQGYPGTGTAR